MQLRGEAGARQVDGARIGPRRRKEVATSGTASSDVHPDPGKNEAGRWGEIVFALIHDRILPEEGNYGLQGIER